MAKTIKEINAKIKKGNAVVLNAEEIIDYVDKNGIEKTARDVDVVTTATFGPMCSSGAYINIGHSVPRIKLGGGHVNINGVPAYAGLAAVDVYIGATAISDDDPGNKVFPGEFKYGGGHVIEDLVAGKDLKLEATAYGTDCYPRKKLDTLINIKDLNEAVLFNPRNAYQNYNVAVNLTDKIIYTYMGILKPNKGNANYCSAGQLSPLLNDPQYKTIGIGTRIFLGGTVGYVVWQGTQHNPGVKREENGVPQVPAGTLAVIGDLKEMSPDYIKGTTLLGYGATLTVGIGIPIPMLDEEICQYVAVKDEDIYTQIIDYSGAYPQVKPDTLGEVNYKQLKSGKISIDGQEVPTGNLSSYSKALEIADSLKDWINEGKFLLSEAIAKLPGSESGYKFKLLNERPLEQ